MKRLSNFKDQVISKSAQKNVQGGRDLNACPSGEFYFYFTDDLGRCAVPGSNGPCYGTLKNNVCHI